MTKSTTEKCTFEGKKKCRICGEEKTSEYYRVGYYYKDKPIWRNECNKCNSEYNKKYEYHRKYIKFENRNEKYKASFDKWKQKNPDYNKHYVERLTDKRIVGYFDRDGLTEFKDNKEFIELKRRFIILKRTIKKLSKNKNHE